MPDQWEYRKTSVWGGDLGLEDELNKYGEQGWEAVSIERGDGRWGIMLKRKKGK